MCDTGMCLQGIAAAEDQDSATGVLQSIGQNFKAGRIICAIVRLYYIVQYVEYTLGYMAYVHLLWKQC